jgi:integrase
MPKSVKAAILETRTARARLKRGRQAHWQPLRPGTHLGYQRPADAAIGRWLLRRYLGGGNRYQVTQIGLADDKDNSNGLTVLSFEQVQAKARAMVETPNGEKVQRVTVRQAMERYCAHKRRLGQSVADVLSRGTAHILPALGDLVVSELTDEKLQQWLFDMAAGPAQNRPKKGKVQYRPEPEGDEAIRKRRATANRVLTMLKAILNYVYDKGHVTHRDAWGRKLKPFKEVETARVRYLSIAEAQRLINACDAEFRPLLRAALETGARYSELARLEVVDFNADSGSISIRRSKAGKSRHIILTEEGAAFFKAHCAGRAGSELMFTHREDNSPWKTAEQSRPMREACERANLKPTASIHAMRHTWASHAVMNGVPLLVVARNLGHRDTRMVEIHYGHLAPGYVADAIRAGAPKYAIAPDTKNVVPLR